MKFNECIFDKMIIYINSK